MSVFAENDLDWLLAKCRRGDRRAWDTLVDRYKNLVYSCARNAGLSGDDADEVFQESFLALYRSLNNIEHAVTIPRWLSTTASREAIRISRKNRKGTLVSFDDPDTGLEAMLASDEAAAEDHAHANLRASVVREALSGLQERCRQLLSMIFSPEPPPYDQIAAQLGIAVGSIGPTRARCIDKLRSNLAKMRYFSESDC